MASMLQRSPSPVKTSALTSDDDATSTATSAKTTTPPPPAAATPTTQTLLSANGVAESAPSSTSANVAVCSSACDVTMPAQRRHSTGSSHRRAKSDPISDADKISIISGDDQSAAAVLTVAALDGNRDTAVAAAGLGADDNDLVQIGDGAFVSRRVYDLSRASSMASERGGGISASASVGMSKLFNLAGRLPNLPTRNRASITTAGGGDGPARSASGGGRTAAMAATFSEDIPRRTTYVLSKLSGGLFGGRQSVGSGDSMTAAAVATGDDVVVVVEEEESADGVEHGAMRMRSTSAGSSTRVDLRIVTDGPGAACAVSSSASTSAVHATAPAAYRPSMSLPSHHVYLEKGDDNDLASTMTSSENTAKAPMELLLAATDDDDASPDAEFGSGMFDDVTALEESYEEDNDDDDADDDDDVGHDECVVQGLEGVLVSRSDTSITTLHRRVVPSPQLTRHRSYDDLTHDDGETPRQAVGSSSSGTGRSGSAKLHHRSPAGRVALTATQPFRRVIKQLMRRSNSDSPSIASVAAELQARGADEAFSSLGQPDLVVAASSLSDSEAPGRLAGNSGGRWRPKASQTTHQQQPPPPSHDLSAALHRRSTSFSGRVPFLSASRSIGSAGTELSIRDLVDAGCSIAAVDTSRSATTVQTSSAPACIPESSATGAVLVASSCSSRSSVGGEASPRRRNTVVTFNPVTMSSAECSTTTSSAGSAAALPLSSAAMAPTIEESRASTADCSPASHAPPVAVATTTASPSTTVPGARTSPSSSGAHHSNGQLAGGNGRGSRLRRTASTQSTKSTRSTGSAGGMSLPGGHGKAASYGRQAIVSSSTPVRSSSGRLLLQVMSVASQVRGGIGAAASWVLRRGPLHRSMLVFLALALTAVCTIVNWSVILSQRTGSEVESLESLYMKMESIEDYRRLLLIEDAQHRKRIEFLKGVLHETESALKEVRSSLAHVSHMMDHDDDSEGSASQSASSSALPCHASLPHRTCSSSSSVFCAQSSDPASASPLVFPKAVSSPSPVVSSSSSQPTPVAAAEVVEPSPVT